MANIKSQIKRNRQAVKARLRNKAIRSTLKTMRKKVRLALAEGDLEAALTRAREAARAYDKAVSKGVLHKRAAARYKSRLAKAVNRAAGTTSSQASAG